MHTQTITTNDGHRLDLLNLLDPTWSNPNGEFASAEFTHDEYGCVIFRGGRTIGVPARVACQIVSSGHTRFIVAHTIREICDVWDKGFPTNTTWTKPFDPSYTEMFPAFHWVTIKPWKMRDRMYEWFLSGPPYAMYPESELLPATIEAVGAAYIRTVHNVIHEQLECIPDGEPIGVTFSGGADSTAVAALLFDLISREGRHNVLHWFTLDIDGGGIDLKHAQTIVKLYTSALGKSLHFHPIVMNSHTINKIQLMQRSAKLLEEYHARDVECGMAGILLSEGIEKLTRSGKIPRIRYDFNGDGGNEIFRDYPLEDEGYGKISLQDVWENPHLYLLGYDRRKLAFNPIFSGGLGRAYTRTFNLSRTNGMTSFSPLIDRHIIDIGQRIPLKALAPHTLALHAFRQAAVCIGLKSVIGVEIPIFPKVRFQEGCAVNPRLLHITQKESQHLKRLVLHSM